jgi:prolipoprotein diacylglyceryltransferase
MWPILLNLGPVKIYSYGLVLVVGLFLGLYFWWKMGRDEHWDEIALFDGFFLSLIVYTVVGRIGYVATHLQQISTVFRALAILTYPGINATVGICAVVGFMILFAKDREWSIYKALDGLSVTMTLVMVFAGLGGMLNGSNPGKSLNFGLTYPGVEGRVIPVDLFIMLWAIVSFLIVSKVRKNFRFYSWYKGEASVAQDGLASLIFVELFGFGYLIVPWMYSNPLKIGFVPADVIIGLVVMGVSTLMIKQKQGRHESKSLQTQLTTLGSNLLQSMRKRRS